MEYCYYIFRTNNLVIQISTFLNKIFNFWNKNIFTSFSSFSFLPPTCPYIPPPTLLKSMSEVVECVYSIASIRKQLTQTTLVRNPPLRHLKEPVHANVYFSRRFVAQSGHMTQLWRAKSAAIPQKFGKVLLVQIKSASSVAGILIWVLCYSNKYHNQKHPRAKGIYFILYFRQQQFSTEEFQSRYLEAGTETDQGDMVLSGLPPAHFQQPFLQSSGTPASGWDHPQRAGPPCIKLAINEMSHRHGHRLNGAGQFLSLASRCPGVSSCQKKLIMIVCFHF